MKMKTLILALSLLSCKSTTVQSALVAQQNPPAPAAVHGMVIFGSDKIYASHIPMFMVPHDWQAHFEIELEHASVDAKEFFQDLARKDGSQQLYTLVPKPFVLPDLLAGKFDSFVADLYQGNFENGGEMILSEVKVKVVKAMNVSQLKKTTAPNKVLSYSLVGNSESPFLSHKIADSATFDQLVEIKWLKPLPTKLSGITLDISDSQEHRLKADQYFKVGANGKLVAVVNPDEADMQVVGEFFCTVGPHFVEGCL